MLTWCWGQVSLGVTPSQFVHIVSHCPYLLAQYCRYKGRDLHATVLALLALEAEGNTDGASELSRGRFCSASNVRMSIFQ